MAFAVTQLQKITASDAAGGDQFGNSVAISSNGTTAVVGANQEDTGANTNNGAVYVYIKSGSTWTEQAKLLTSDAATDDRLGESIAISADGNTVLVGAWSENTPPNSGNGAAYIFTRSGTTWTQQAKLLASDAASAEYLGLYQSVSLSADGNTALVAASYKVGGAAYVFTRSGSTWTQQQKITASDAASGDRFGYSVSLSSDGNTAIMGAFNETTSPNTNQGAAYVFTRSGSTWTEQQKLLASDPANTDYFGFSVALSGDGNTAIVGSVNEDTSSTTNNGAIYMYTRSAGTWTQRQKILANDATTDDNIGHAVSLSSDGGIAIVGSRHINAGGVFDTGGVYLFTRSGGTWTQRQKIIASDTVTDDRFGQSVSLSSDGTTFIVGANQEDTGANTNNGAAYFFNINLILDNKIFSYSSASSKWEIISYLEIAKPSAHVFTSSGSWEIPVGAKIVNVVCVGAGGGGGGGARNATSRGGGVGGAGGGVSEFMFRASDLGGAGTSISLTVGAAGAAGAATASGTTYLAGNAGSAGGNTSFGSYLVAKGGGGGAGGNATQPANSASGEGMWYGNYGSDISSTVSNTSGGGAGGSGSGGAATFGSGGLPTSVNLTAATTASAAGPANTFYNGAGGGGAGGSSSTTTPTTAGAGGFPGGGGGGGGEGSTAGGTGAGGAAGAGAAGMVAITVWYG